MEQIVEHDDQCSASSSAALRMTEAALYQGLSLSSTPLGAPHFYTKAFFTLLSTQKVELSHCPEPDAQELRFNRSLGQQMLATVDRHTAHGT